MADAFDHARRGCRRPTGSRSSPVGCPASTAQPSSTRSREVNSSAASLPCRSASSRSSSRWSWLVPEMLRVPPAPVPERLHRLAHGRDHHRVLPHAQIVVRAPDRHVAHPVLSVVCRARELAAFTLQLGEVRGNCPRSSGCRAVIGTEHQSPWVGLFLAVGASDPGSIQRQSFASGNGSTISQCSSSASDTSAVSRAKLRGLEGGFGDGRSAGNRPR